MKRSAVLAAMLLIFLSLPTAAQTRSETYGTQSLTYVSLSAWNFVALDSTTTYEYSLNPWGVYLVNCCIGGGFLEAGLRLPAGAHVEYLEVTVCDSTATGHFDGQLTSVDHLGQRSGYDFSLTTNQESVSCVPRAQTLPTPFTVDNVGYLYYLQIYFSEVTPSLMLVSARVGYKLQVSPAPVMPAFSDVQTNHPFYQYIEALATSGITAGCGNGQFCPDAPLTRGQMAVFLAKALGLHWAP
jgi:S-layer family protein